jgi:hypothetical protein
MSALNSTGDIRSARAVEPLTSANSIVPVTSAPPWYLISAFWHAVQRCGLAIEGFRPITRMNGAPSPPNGAVQSRQRGSLGMALNTFRPIRMYGSPFSR